MKNSLTDQQQRFVLYSSADGNIHVDVVLQDETVWLTQKAMGLLFGVESHTITYHLKEIFRSGELDEKATTRKIRAVQNEGKRQVTRELDFYNLDAIISVGYRVNSYQATQFRIWATKIHMGLTGWKHAPDGKILMKMQDWIRFLHSFLELSNYPILQDKNYISDFDKEIKRIKGEKYD